MHNLVSPSNGREVSGFPVINLPGMHSPIKKSHFNSRVYLPISYESKKNSKIQKIIEALKNFKYSFHDKEIPLSKISVFEKFCQITEKVGELLKIVNRVSFFKFLNVGISGLNFFDSYGEYQYFKNAFSKDTLDQHKLKESLKITVKKYSDEFLDRDVDNAANAIFQEIMNHKKIKSKQDVTSLIKNYCMREHLIDPTKANEISKDVVVCKEKRSAIKWSGLALCTVGDTVSNLLTAKEWLCKIGQAAITYGKRFPILTTMFGKVGKELGKVSATIGKHFPIFSEVGKAITEKVLGSLFCGGFILMIGEAGHRFFKLSWQIYYCKNEEELLKLKNERFNAGLDFIKTSLDFVSVLLPLIGVVNPPVALVLGIIAKGTGALCILLHK